MDWTEVPQARPLAAAYVVGFLAWLAGVLWILYNQVTDGSTANFAIGIVLFVVGQLAIISVAFAVRGQFLGPRGQGAFGQSWNRLSLGLELPTAVRLLRSR